MYQNKVILIGFLGNDAEVRNANNRSFTTFSLATKSSYKDKRRRVCLAHRMAPLRGFRKLSEFAARCRRAHMSRSKARSAPGNTTARRPD